MQNHKPANGLLKSEGGASDEAFLTSTKLVKEAGLATECGAAPTFKALGSESTLSLIHI